MPDLYSLVEKKANAIEQELKVVNRWQHEPLEQSRFENMGAFGSNTMTFEQWIQFVLIPRIRTIIGEKDEFPSNSMLATYASRVFDGDVEMSTLSSLLSDLDMLINNADDGGGYESETDFHREIPEPENTDPDLETSTPLTVSLGDSNVPKVLFTLAEVLPMAEGQYLEDQLETFDTFLGFLSPVVRPQIASMFIKASMRAISDQTRARLKKAAESVSDGGRASARNYH